MKLIRLIPLVLLLLAAAPYSHAFGTGAEGCSGDCTACHSITQKEAQDLVTPFGKDLEVLEVKPAPARSLYQAIVRKGKEESIIYIDFSKKFLFIGTLIDAGRKANVTGDELTARKRVNVSAINLDNALTMGNPHGSKRLYVFTDPECPFCATLHGELTQLVKEDPQLLVSILLYPLPIHPNAAWKTDSIICTAKKDMAEGLKLLEQSFAGKQLEKVVCDKNYAETAKKQATDLAIGMTPTVVFSDGRMVMGKKSKDELKKMLAEAASGGAGKTATAH